MAQIITNYRNEDPNLLKSRKLNNKSYLSLGQNQPEDLAISAECFQSYYLHQGLNQIACTLASQIKHYQFSSSILLKIISNELEGYQDELKLLSSLEPIIPKLEPQEVEFYNIKLELPIKYESDSSYFSPENHSIEIKNEIQIKGEETKISKEKSSQSRYKNSYGLVTARVIKTVQEYLRLIRCKSRSHEINSDPRFYYIHKRIEHLSDDKSFEKFLSEYYARSSEMKKRRGKATVYDFLSKDVNNGLVLIELIQDFLEIGNADLQDYLLKGKKCKKNIIEVLGDETSLAYLREMFEEMKIKLQKLTKD